MGEQAHFEAVVEKLRDGEHFGLFEDGQKCYFQDGTRVRYSVLWSALRQVRHLEGIHKKTLPELCPDSFEGSFPYSFSRHKWKRKPDAKP